MIEKLLTPNASEHLFQLGFVARDIRASMAQFTEKLGIGPWFLRERGVFPTQFYKGEPTGLALAVAMAYPSDGSIQYEIIQQLDDSPSIYQDVLRRQTIGFHHFGIMTRDFEASVSRHKGQGFEPVYEAQVPGGRVCFFDTADLLSGMIEIVEATPSLESMFGGYRDAALEWDGEAPVRMRPPIPASR